MASELGAGNTYPDLLPKLARFELALMRFAEENLGSRSTASSPTSAGRRSRRRSASCPATSTRGMAAAGIPVACEVDIYGALSEYICQLASDAPATLLDINNTVPPDMVGGDRRPEGRGAGGPVHGLPLRQHAELPHEELLDEVPAHHEPADGGPVAGRRTSPAARWKASCSPARPRSSACRAAPTASWSATSPRATSSTSTRAASAASASSRSRTSPGSTATC